MRKSYGIQLHDSLVSILCESIDRREPVAIFLSSGCDSTSLLYSLLELEIRPTVYSFMLDRKLSTDFTWGQRSAKKFNLDFVPVFLPTSHEILIHDIHYMIFTLGLRKKTAIECTWPMMYAIRATSENQIVTGSCADGHFVVSKKGMMHFRSSVELMDQFRESLFSNPDYAQVSTLSSFASTLNKRMIVPYRDKRICDIFKGTSWDEINYPKQKQPIYDAFKPLFMRGRFKNHMNLQLGDSGIADHFASLLSHPVNTLSYKSPAAFYAAIADGKIKL